jgi:hypothetical protein
VTEKAGKILEPALSVNELVRDVLVLNISKGYEVILKMC